MKKTNLKFGLTKQLEAQHTAFDDVYIQIPEIKDQEMIPWSMENSWFYPLILDCQSNQMLILFKLHKGIGIPTHYHCGPTFGYTLKGEWRYAEREDMIMKAGSFILEFPGVMHTVDILSDEPALMIVNMKSGILFVDKLDNENYKGEIKMYQDPYYFYNRAKDYYKEQNLDFNKIEKITTLGTSLTQYQYMP